MRSYQLCVEHNWLLSLLSRRQANAKMIMFSIPRDSLNLYKYYAKMPNALLQWKQGLESSGTKLAKLIEKHHKGKRERRGNLQKAGLKVMWKMCWVFSFCVRSEKWPLKIAKKEIFAQHHHRPNAIFTLQQKLFKKENEKVSLFVVLKKTQKTKKFLKWN